MNWITLTLFLNTITSAIIMAAAVFYFRKSEKKVSNTYFKLLLRQHYVFIAFFFLVVTKDILILLPWTNENHFLFLVFSFAYVPLSFSVFKMMVCKERKNSIWQALYKFQADKQEKERYLNDLESMQHATSHQIRSPLGAIAKKMNRLERNLSNMTEEQIQTIARQSKELAIEIGDLLDSLPREFSSTPQYTESCFLIDSISITLKRIHEIVVENDALIEVDEGCAKQAKLSVDVMTLANIFQILLENAIKYCSSNTEPTIQINCMLLFDFYEVRVIDNGIGIPENKWDEIFEGGVRLKKEKKGTGVGLSLARRLVANFGGFLNVEYSNQNEGSIFLLQIPKAKECIHELTPSLASRR